MSNPLYNSMNNQNNFIQKFNEFRKNFNGNPQEQVQQLLNSGKVSQAQYNRAVQDKDINEILEIIDELMSTLQVLHPRLYDGVMIKIAG